MSASPVNFSTGSVAWRASARKDPEAVDLKPRTQAQSCRAPCSRPVARASSKPEQGDEILRWGPLHRGVEVFELANTGNGVVATQRHAVERHSRFSPGPLCRRVQARHQPRSGEGARLDVNIDPFAGACRMRPMSRIRPTPSIPGAGEYPRAEQPRELDVKRSNTSRRAMPRKHIHN